MKTTCKVPFKMMISRRYYFKKPMGKLVSTNITSIKKCCQFGLPCCFFCLRILNCIRGSNIEKKHRWWLSPRMLQPSILQRGLWTIPKTTCDADWWGFPGSRRSFHTTWNWREQLSFLYKMPYKLKSDNFLIHVSTENPGKSTGTSAFNKNGLVSPWSPCIAFNPTQTELPKPQQVQQIGLRNSVHWGHDSDTTATHDVSSHGTQDWDPP